MRGYNGRACVLDYGKQRTEFWEKLNLILLMAAVKTFEELAIWQMARGLSKQIYDLSFQESFFKDWPLRDQIRKASGSIMDNIAEGFERDGNREFIQFLSISKGSCGEVRSQLYRAHDLGYLDSVQLENLKNHIRQIEGGITRMIQALKQSQRPKRK